MSFERKCCWVESVTYAFQKRSSQNTEPDIWQTVLWAPVLGLPLLGAFRRSSPHAASAPHLEHHQSPVTEY